MVPSSNLRKDYQVLRLLVSKEGFPSHRTMTNQREEADVEEGRRLELVRENHESK